MMAIIYIRLKHIFCTALYLLILLGACVAAHADYVEVILLGTGTPKPSIERFGSATLVNASGKYFLFDAGRGVTVRLQQAGMTPDQIDHVFLTHLHSDHISGLDDLWITGWVWQRQKLLQVYGPQGTHQFVQGLRKAYAADISYRTKNTGLENAKSQINSREIAQGVIYQEAGVTIKAFLVDHAPVFPALAYRIEFGDRAIVISGDTTYSNNLVRHAQGVDVLIHEIAAANASLLKRNKRLQQVMAYHTNPEQLVRILNATRPRMAVLNHVLMFGVSSENVLQEINTHYHGDVQIAYDLMRIGIGNEISIEAIKESEMYE